MVENEENPVILQVIPAEPGWNLVYAEEDGSIHLTPLRFWALVERDGYGSKKMRTIEPMEPNDWDTRYFAEAQCSNLLGTLPPVHEDSVLNQFRAESQRRAEEERRARGQ